MQPDSSSSQELASSILVLQYSCLAAIVVYFYDYLMTFSLEVEVVWGRKMSANITLLLLNRYMTLFAYIPTSVLLFNRPENLVLNLGVLLLPVFLER